MQLTKNMSRLINGAFFILMGVLQLTHAVDFVLWLVILILGIFVILDAQAR